MDSDLAIRLAAFSWLTEKTAAFGDVLPRTLLQEGFIFEGTRIPFVAPHGIFKPKVLDLPLTITTTPGSPYNDTFSSDGLLTYRYRGTNPNHSDNVGLRKIMEQKRPLVYLHGVVSGQYLTIWPVYIVADDPATLAFKVAVDDVANIEVQADQLLTLKENMIARRAYITATVKVRLHQRSFRERVLEAYRTRSRCAICVTGNCSMQRTSYLIALLKAIH